MADFASENEHGYVGATGRIRGQQEYDAIPASMRKHLTSASFRSVMPINNALPNADCNDTRVGKGIMTDAANLQQPRLESSDVGNL